MTSRRLLAITLALFMTACGERWSKERVAETTRRGDALCKAVDAYRVKTGKYPSQLSDLQPEFLRDIPKPTAGAKQWEYHVIVGGTNYWLRVVGSEWGPILSRGATGEWQYLPGDSK